MNKRQRSRPMAKFSWFIRRIIEKRSKRRNSTKSEKVGLCLSLPQILDEPVPHDTNEQQQHQHQQVKNDQHHHSLSIDISAMIKNQLYSSAKFSALTKMTRTSSSCGGDCSSIRMELPMLIQCMLWDEVGIFLNKFPQEAGWWQMLPLLGGSGDESFALPLHLACANSSTVDVVHQMVRLHPRGPSTQDSRWGKLPLHFACIKHGGPDVIRALLEAFPDGASVVDHDQRFPLHYACIYGTVEEVSLLFDAYPKATLGKDKAGRSPSCAAMMSSNPEKLHIVAFLEDRLDRMNVPINISIVEGCADDMSVISCDVSSNLLGSLETSVYDSSNLLGSLETDVCLLIMTLVINYIFS